MAQAIFIDESYLKTNSVIDENVSAEYIRPTILEAQDMYIHPFLGTGLYNKLKTDVIASTVTGDYKTLLEDYVQKTLMFYTLVELTPVMVYKYMNKTVAEKNSENSISADQSDINYLMERWRNKAQWYGQRLIDYLCENQTLFPEYTNPGTGQDIIRPDKDTAFEESWYLGTDNYEGDDVSSLEDNNQD